MTEVPLAAQPGVSSSSARTLSGRLHPVLGWAAAALVVLGFAADAWWHDATPRQVLFTAAVALCLVALLTFATRRLLVAAVVIGTALAILRAASVVKLQLTDLTLHSYDAFSFLTSWRAIAAFAADHSGYAAALLAAIAAGCALAAIAWHFDGVRLSRWSVAAAVAVFAAAAWLSAPVRYERSHAEVFEADSFLPFFFSSWPETLEALWRGHVIEASTRASGPLFSIPATCDPAGKSPHIILIHEESVVQPSHFPALSYDKSLDPLFRSHDGKLHKLRVETYGGASWLTEFSVLTGVSANSSGGLRNFVRSVMTGKVRDTLPQALARCGYRNLAVYPMLRIYMSMEKFFASVGIPEMLGADEQGTKNPNERDRFYFGNALAALERHLAASKQPMFIFIETMATHSAYDYTYMPEVNVPGGGPGTQPQMHEYLRRLSMARIDYDELKADLARRFPGERFLLVHYGDHQPHVTLPLLGFDEYATFEQVVRSGNDAAFITYYAVDGVGYRPPALPPADVLDVPYLGTVILEAARLPLSDAYRERKRLMALCEGRYHSCVARGAILDFHRRMMDSGLMDAL